MTYSVQYRNATHQNREDQSHNVDGPRWAEAGQDGETEVVLQWRYILVLCAPQLVNTPVQRALGAVVHLWRPGRHRARFGTHAHSQRHNRHRNQGDVLSVGDWREATWRGWPGTDRSELHRLSRQDMMI